MKFGIMYEPTKEYVAFKNGDKVKLFSEDEKAIQNAIADVATEDNIGDFQLITVDYDTDGSEFCDDDKVFVAQSLVK